MVVSSSLASAHSRTRRLPYKWVLWHKASKAFLDSSTVDGRNKGFENFLIMRCENYSLGKYDGTKQYYYLYEIRRKRNPDANLSPFWVAWLLSTDQKFWRYLQPLSDWPRRVHFSPRAWGWLDAAVSLVWIVWGRRCLILDSDLRFCWTVSAPICVHPRVCSEGIWGHLKRQTSCGTGRSRIPWTGKPQPVWGSFWWPRWQSKRTQRQQSGICKYKEATMTYDLFSISNGNFREWIFMKCCRHTKSTLKQLSLKISPSIPTLMPRRWSRS